jgi:glucokinase
MTTEHVAVGVDIGGTKVSAGLVDGGGALLYRTAMPTDGARADDLTDRVLALIDDVIDQAVQEVAGVGIGIAAAVDPAVGQVLWAPNIPGWVDIPLGRLVHEATGLPANVGFDGHFAALGEHWVGRGRGVCNMVLVIIGTGVGGGLILDGRLYQGAQNLAGAVGWMVAEPDSLGTDVSRSLGNVESLVSGPAIVRSAEQSRPDDAQRAEAVTPESVVQWALNGDAVSQDILRRAGDCLGRAVVGIVSLLNPELVLLGGGVGTTGVYLDAVREAVDSFAQPISRRSVRVEQASLGNDAGLIGAARAVFQKREGMAAQSAGAHFD